VLYQAEPHPDNIVLIKVDDTLIAITHPTDVKHYRPRARAIAMDGLAGPGDGRACRNEKATSEVLG
jgi:hypothetical protein